MRIAFTGTSSTGKTMLAGALEEEPLFRAAASLRINVDSRQLLREMGHAAGIDSMTREQRRAFQARFFLQKQRNEDGRLNYLTERSFVDAAAYWIDTSNDPSDLESDFVRACMTEARRYDLHVYFPSGIIPFAMDGMRSNDPAYHATISSSMRRLLLGSGLRFVELGVADLRTRVTRVLNAIRGIA